MKPLDEIKKELVDFINENNIDVDFTDLGNTIGIIIGKYINDKMGFDKDSFIQGVKHGISLSDGNHP
ncbi:MAG: hypothetical protein WDA02_10925 [Saccharofermentanales bacterium]